MCVFCSVVTQFNAWCYMVHSWFHHNARKIFGQVLRLSYPALWRWCSVTDLSWCLGVRVEASSWKIVHWPESEVCGLVFSGLLCDVIDIIHAIVLLEYYSVSATWQNLRKARLAKHFMLCEYNEEPTVRVLKEWSPARGATCT